MEENRSTIEVEIQEEQAGSRGNFSLRKFTIKFFAGLLVLIFCSYFFFFKAPKNFPENAIKNIEVGTTLRSLSFDLKKEGYINSRMAFESFVILYGGERHIQPGDFLFKNKLPVFELARRISLGIRGLDPLRITIPEGYNSLEISEVFDSKLPNFNEEEFLKNAMPLEGYLFPDTYFFFPTATEADVIKSMRENFDKKVGSLSPTTHPEGPSQENTLKKVVTMASIIEKEANGDEDREYISGILWKRLDIGMALQVDAWPESYDRRGLPDKPIANPGLEAIRAAMNPKSSEYLYYLHDNAGVIHYARSFSEHKANIAKYLK
jgi:UPF0755 protein